MARKKTGTSFANHGQPFRSEFRLYRPSWLQLLIDIRVKDVTTKDLLPRKTPLVNFNFIEYFDRLDVSNKTHFEP